MWMRKIVKSELESHEANRNTTDGEDRKRYTTCIHTYLLIKVVALVMQLVESKQEVVFSLPEPWL